MIQSHGSSNPSAFFIADAPFGEDLRSGYALTGYQENSIMGFLRDNKLDLRNFWRTCLIKEELPVKDTKDLKNEKNLALIDPYGKYLIDEIEQLKPNLLIPLGELSFNFLTKLNQIRKFRGSILPSRADLMPGGKIQKILPILGPYPYLNQEYRLKYITAIDYTKVPKHIHDTPIPDNFYNVWICRSSSAFRAFIDRAYPICIANNSFLVFDIETYLGIPTCISFCFDGFESVCVPLLDTSIDFDIRCLMISLVAKLLASPVKKVNQNIKFDWKILERYGIIVNNVFGDTMLATNTLYCEFDKNLGFLTSIYTDIPYFKDESKKDYNPETYNKERFYKYNAKDSLATHQIHTKQLGEIEEQGVSYVYQSLIKLIPVYKRMENRGIRINPSIQERLLAKYTSLFDTEEIKLKRLIEVQYINSLSHVQMRKVVYDVLGYKRVKGIGLTKAGEPKTDEDALDLLLTFGKAERAPSTGPIILQTIINCRKFHKVMEILELPLHPDNRFRCEFNLAGTETGRTSAGETTDDLIIIDGKKITTQSLGHSLQTIGKHGFAVDGITYGKDLRSMFIPSPGYRFIEVDLSGAEARVDRILSGNFNMEVFNNPGIHRLTGSWVFDCQPSEIKKGILVDGIDRYHASKIVRHAGERNIQPPRLAVMLQRPEKECDTLLKKFHKFQPEIKQVYHQDIIKSIDETRCLVMPNGRRRDFFDRISPSMYNEGISTPPQAIVSDQTKFEGILNTFTNENSWMYLLAEMHDGILAEVPIGREKEAIEIYQKNVETEIDFSNGSLKRDYKLIIPSEGSIGDDWYAMEEVK